MATGHLFIFYLNYFCYNITYSGVEEVFAEISVTLDYNYSGSTPYVITLSDGETLNYPTSPTRSSYAFAGWYIDSGCTTSYDFNGPITEDITLYAKWIYSSNTILSPNSSNTVYLSSGSTYYSFVALQTGNVTISIGKNGYLNNGSIGGYSSITFSCTKGVLYSFYAESYYGYTSSSYVGNTTLTISSSLPTSTATGNCGMADGYVYDSSSTASATITYGATYTLPTPTRTGYTFLG